MTQRWLLKIMPILALAFILAFAFGLLARRFDFGAEAQPYSSYRTDPVGTRVLYETILRMPGYEALRWQRPIEELDGDSGTLVLILGVTSIPKVTWKGIRVKASAGTHFLIGIAPNTDKSALQKLGIDECVPSVMEGIYRKEECPGPNRLPWNYACEFRGWDSHWKPLYAALERNHAGVLERIGSGIEIWGGSYLFSNEALANKLVPGLLEARLGKYRRIVFWEVPHGVKGTYSMAMLLRKSGMTVFLASFFLTMALFLWNQAMLPGRKRPAEVLRPRNTVEGLAGLFRRSIPKQDLFPKCLALWKRDCAARIPAPRLEAMQQLQAQASQKTFGELYQSARQILKIHNTSKTQPQNSR